MPILIDGWNLIRDSASPINDGDDILDSAASLISTLSDFQCGRADPIIVVFDSRSGHLDHGCTDTVKVKVVATRDADNYIKRYLDRIPEKQRKNVRVVSSDNDVYYYARSLYAITLRSAEFWGTIKKDAATKKRNRDVQGDYKK